MVSQYLSNEIVKEDIQKWAEDMMYKMLQGEIVKLDNVQVWGMLTELSGINDMDSVYVDEVILKINQILLGNISNSYSFFIQIPKRLIVNNLPTIKDSLLKYQAQKELLSADVSMLKQLTDKTSNNTIRTLNDMIEIQILDLLKQGYDFYPEEACINFDLKHTVFISEETSLEIGYLLKIIALLDCYDGSKGFNVHIIFNEGMGNISIQT